MFSLCMFCAAKVWKKSGIIDFYKSKYSESLCFIIGGNDFLEATFFITLSHKR